MTEGSCCTRLYFAMYVLNLYADYDIYSIKFIWSGKRSVGTNSMKLCDLDVLCGEFYKTSLP